MEKFKEALLKEKATLEEQLKSVSVQNPNDPKDWQPSEDVSVPEADPNVVADRAEESIEHQAITADLETRYEAVQKALESIERGTYGICAVCEKHIEEDRLVVNPAATTCKEHLNEDVV